MQFGGAHPGQFLPDVSAPKQAQATKNNMPMTGISAGLAGRASGKGSRAAGSTGAGPKR